MHLTLTPTRGLAGRPETVLSVSGDILTCDGVAYDLSPVPEGGEATAEDSPFFGPITRLGGVIHATVRVILDDSAAPNQPDILWVIPDADGPVAIPAVRIPTPQEVLE